MGHFVCRVPWSRCAPPQAAGTAPRRAPPPAVGPPRLLGRACRPRCRLTAKACAVHLAVSETPCLHPSVFSPCARGHADEQKKMQRAVTPPFRLCPFLVLTARKRGRATWPTPSGPCGSRGGRAPRRRGARGRAARHLAVPCPWDACRYPQHRVPSASIRLLCGASVCGIFPCVPVLPFGWWCPSATKAPSTPLAFSLNRPPCMSREGRARRPRMSYIFSSLSVWYVSPPKSSIPPGSCCTARHEEVSLGAIHLLSVIHDRLRFS